ncbi:MAG: DUF1353 domain-containing protein [Flavobacteriales bacterium]
MNRILLSHISGTMRWTVESPFKLSGIEVPKGYITDLASVPRAFWCFFPPSGAYLEAAVVHDYCYTNLTQAMTKKQADKLFLKNMKKLGTGRCKRFIMYVAVRLFGRGNW